MRAAPTVRGTTTKVASASLHSTTSMATEIPTRPKIPPIVGLRTPGESVPSRVWTSLTNRLMRSPVSCWWKYCRSSFCRELEITVLKRVISL